MSNLFGNGALEFLFLKIEGVLRGAVLPVRSLRTKPEPSSQTEEVPLALLKQPSEQAIRNAPCTTMQLSEIVPWGRSYQEYAAMFALSPADSRRRIIGCADGPAS